MDDDDDDDKLAQFTIIHPMVPYRYLTSSFANVYVIKNIRHTQVTYSYVDRAIRRIHDES